MTCMRSLFVTAVAATASLAVSGTALGAVFIAEPTTTNAATSFPTVTGPGGTTQSSITSVAVDGVTLTLTQAGGNAGGVSGSNDGGGGIGVTGNGSFDINGSESLTLTFNQDVYLDQLSFRVFGFGESVDLSIPSLAIATNVAGNQTFTPAVAGITAPGVANGGFILDFTAETFEISTGDTIVISAGAGSGILVDSVSVTAVPEPGSLALLGLGATFMIRRKR